MHVVYEGSGVVAPRALTWRERIILGWGKIRRFYLLTFRQSYVEESLKRRVGVCHRTGACCRLMFSCPLLGWLKRMPICRIYQHRPRNCTVFPIDERDLRDRDIVNPDHPCGFAFLSRKEAGDVRKKPAETVLHV